MIQYHDLLKRTLAEGSPCDDRTGVGTIAIFGHQSRYYLSPDAPGAHATFIKDGTQAGFPAITTKKLHLRSIIHELLWFLRGDTNTAYLKENGVRIWDEWADDNGDLGPVYGSQWRSWKTPDGSSIDQIANLVEGLTSNPFSRRHIVTAWNPAEIDQMALPACHCLFQFNVQRAPDGGADFLNCQLYQRSADLFLGVPFNIASYALLTMMIAQVTNYRPGSFVHTLADAHIYINHLPQVDEQLARECRPLPTMQLNSEIKSIFDFTIDDFELQNYEPHPHIKATVAV